jgi:hypothetical protein
MYDYFQKDQTKAQTASNSVVAISRGEGGGVGDGVVSEGLRPTRPRDLMPCDFYQQGT